MALACLPSSVLQCAAVCCNALQRVAVRSRMCGRTWCVCCVEKVCIFCHMVCMHRACSCVAVMLQCVACVAVCSMMCCWRGMDVLPDGSSASGLHLCCSVLQCVAVCCSVLQCVQ